MLVCLLSGRALGETISTGSRQFQTESASVTLARMASEQAEAIRRRLIETLSQPDHFLSPVRISFEESELGDDLEDYVYTVSAEPGVSKWSYSIRATKDAPEGGRALAWPEAVVTALQYEMANRVRGKKGGGLVTWPAWFLWGMTGLSDEATHRNVEELWTSKYHRKTYRSLEHIWKTPASAAADEKERIQVLSTWLIQELARLPNGRAKLSRVAYEINRGNFSASAFQEIYGTDFPSIAAADRWWTSRLAFFEHGSELASMDFDSTVRRLREALDGGLPEPGIQGLDERGMEDLNEVTRDLYRLMVAGHPMVRPATETLVNALEAVRENDMRRARPSWEKGRRILDSLGPWRNQINSALDQREYLLDQETSRRWLDKKGVTD